jgi:hypothetical protein
MPALVAGNIQIYNSNKSEKQYEKEEKPGDPERFRSHSHSGFVDHNFELSNFLVEDNFSIINFLKSSSENIPHN